jgi:SSS family solute:Na+ symporter
MTVFYSLLGVCLFVPVLGGLYSRRAGSAEALGSIGAGVLTLLVVRFWVAGRYGWLDPTLAGLMAAALVFFGILLARGRGSLDPPQGTASSSGRGSLDPPQEPKTV